MTSSPSRPASAEVGWGVVGTGRVATQMATSLRASSAARAVTVLSRDGRRGELFAAQHGVEAACTSMEELLADDRVEVVYVASPNGAHVDHVVSAARAGKHVLCEKPMANDLDGCRQMAQACAAAGVHLALGFQYRMHPAHVAMRSLIRRGAIGTPMVADSSICLPAMEVPRWYDDQDLAGGGVIPMSGVHRLDLLAFLLDRSPLLVAAVTHSRLGVSRFEDVAAAVVQFEADLLATVRFSMDTPHGGDGLVIHGTEGSVRATGTTTQWWGGGGGEVTRTSAAGSHTAHYDSTDLYEHEVAAFHALLRGEQTTLADAADGAGAVAVAWAIYESARTGRHVGVPSTGIPRREETP